MESVKRQTGKLRSFLILTSGVKQSAKKTELCRRKPHSLLGLRSQTAPVGLLYSYGASAVYKALS